MYRERSDFWSPANPQLESIPLQDKTATDAGPGESAFPLKEGEKMTSHNNRLTHLIRWLMVFAIAISGFFAYGAAAQAQAPAIAATSSTIANPEAYIPGGITYARVPSSTPVYSSVNAVQANNPFTNYGGGSFWVSVHGSRNIAGTSYNWVSWGWDTYGWIRSNALSYDAQLSNLRGVDLTERAGEQLAMVHNGPLNVRSEPGLAGQETVIGQIQRYDVVSVLDQTVVGGTPWYLIGDGQWIHSGFVRNFTSTARPDGVGANDRWIQVNLTEQVVIAHVGDTPVYATLTATGRPGYETVTGLYYHYVAHRTAPMRWLDADPPYSYSDVPYIQYFHQGYGLHGVYWHDNYGTVQSAGCVNLSPYDAHWFFQWAGPNVPEGQRTAYAGDGNLGTWVYVHY
jgi:hypothetical protein